MEPGRTIARILEDRAGARVYPALVPGVDAVVNSYRLAAGVSRPLEDLAVEAFLQGISANLTDAFFTCQAAAAQMVEERRTGCLVNVTSVAGVVAIPGQAAFCAAMAALSATTKVLATEWSSYGIRVAAVAAGVSSELVAGVRTLPGVGQRVPAGAVVDHEQVAVTVRFVRSEGGSGIAGVPVFVDNGWLSDGYWESLA